MDVGIIILGRAGWMATHTSIYYHPDKKTSSNILASLPQSILENIWLDSLDCHLEAPPVYP
jgi:hypothetical protein